MGFFKSLNELQKQGKELQKNSDPGQQMADGMAKMKEANAMMAAQTQAANLAMSGKDATGSITGVVQTGALINFQPSMQIDMTVFPEGGVPYPVSVTQVVETPYLSKAVPGSQIKLKVDPSDPNIVWIDWASSMTL